MPSGSCPTRTRPLSRRRRKVIHNLRKANYPCGRQGRLVRVRLGRAADTAGPEQVEDLSGADRARAEDRPCLWHCCGRAGKGRVVAQV
jgi:hypothetical protein